MSFLFFDPFTQYGTSTTLALATYDTYGLPYGSSSSFVLGTSYGRFANAGGSSFAGFGCTKNIPTQTGTVFASFSIKPVNTTGSYGYGVLMSFRDNATSQIAFALNSSMKVTIIRGTIGAGPTILATSSASVSTGAWHRFEFQVLVNGSTGFAECVVDGVSLVNFTGNTNASGVNEITTIGFADPNNGFSGNMTDILVYNTSGAAPTGYLGDKRFYTQVPSADGSATAWSANWASFANSTAYILGQQLEDGNNNVQQCTTAGTSASSGTPTWATTTGLTTTSSNAVFTCMGAAASYKAVNENPSDGDNSYLSDSTVSDEQGFLFPTLPGTVTGIVGVGIMASARKDDAGTRSIRLEVKSGSTVVDNGTDFLMSTSYQYQQAFFPVDPQTSSGWTLAGVNAVEARIKTTA